MEKWKKGGRKVCILGFWIVFWQILTWLVNSKILLAGPVDVLSALLQQMSEAEFYLTALCSLLRIACGFFLAFFLGIAVGAAAYRLPLLEELLEPVVFLFKSVPVASFVVLLLIWFGPKKLTGMISFLVVFPMIYYSVLGGARETDPKMLEMARVFHMPLLQKIRHLYVPAVWPSLTAACKTALGMAWKSGVAAEVIGTPSHSIGEKLYMAKITLGTAELFAWTLVLIVLSYLFEKTVLFAVEWFGEEKPGMAGRYFLKGEERERKQADAKRLYLHNVKKSYGDHTVFQNLNVSMTEGQRMGVFAPSGTGKTTFLRILMGLEQTDGGVAETYGAVFSVVFQEDRLCEKLTAADNVRIVNCTISEEKIQKNLRKLLPQEAFSLPVCALSGGMKRRAALVRAMTAPGDVVLLDEPFTGLDEASKEAAIQYINRQLSGRMLIVASHDPTDFQRLGVQSLLVREKDGSWKQLNV